MRLLLVGAFPYPYPQGSQVYFQEQAIALRAAGADVELLTYASGITPRPSHPDDWRALDGFRHHRGPAWSAPRSLRSGPGWGKPLADLALAVSIRRAMAAREPASPFDAVLAHNAEACTAATLALALRSRPSTPLVYCVHTLLARELSAYRGAGAGTRVESSVPGGASAFARTRKRVLDRCGRVIDHRLARRADGWIALTPSAAHAMRRASTAVGGLIPPPIPDPLRAWIALDPDGVAQRHGLVAKRFDLYSGNLDGYQEIERLVEVQRRRTTNAHDASDPRQPADTPPPIVIASHDAGLLESERLRASGMLCRHVPDPHDMLGLLAAARASLVLRRAEGGYPIKLANSLAVGTPPVAFLEREWSLSDGENAIIAGGSDPTTAFCEALERLDRDPSLAPRLGRGARALYEENHRPARVAARSLALLERVIRARPSGLV